MKTCFKILLFSLTVGLVACNSKDEKQSKIVEEKTPEPKAVLSGMFGEFLELSDTIELAKIVSKKLADVDSTSIIAIQKTDLEMPLALSNAYNKNQFNALWITSFLADSAFKALEEIENDGLLIADYSLQNILELREKCTNQTSKSLAEWADLDMLITNALLAYGRDLLRGKVDPKSLNESWNFTPRSTAQPLELTLVNAQKKGNLSTYFNEVRPQNSMYLNMRKSLLMYKLIAQNGGWDDLVWISEKSKLEPGDKNPIVPALRVRLIKENLLDSSNIPQDSVYDAALQNAVAHFQTQHGLYADSVVGKSTLKLLNISAEEKVQAIVCNLERMRWAIGDIGGTYILVNAAQFKLWYFQQDTVSWSTEVIIGAPYNATPFFKTELVRVIFNPTWTLPYSIATKEMLPKLRKDSNYLASQNMVLMNRQREIVDPLVIDFDALSLNNFPYVIRQQPGKTNSLGLVKFHMPNPYSIYMHDTPSKNLFKREERAFSHGCIRVNRPMILADIVLHKNEGWHADSIQAILDSGQTTQISLVEKIPVLLLYLTQYTDSNGQAFFFKDVYKADKKLLAILTEEPNEAK